MSIFQLVDQMLLPVVGYGGAALFLYGTCQCRQTDHKRLAQTLFLVFSGLCLALWRQGMI